jgi:chromosome segregation ATPase
VPQLAALLAACAKGRAREVRDEVERHLAQNPEDPRAGFLLRLVTAAAPDYGTALKAIEEECNARQTQAVASLTSRLESAKAELAKAVLAESRSRAELEGAKAETERARSEAASARAEAASARVEAESARAEAESAQAEAASARAEAASARAEVASTRAETASARSEAQQARAEAESVRAEADSARAEAESARNEAQQARAESERTRAASEEETNRLAAKQEHQAALIDKIAYVNEELERQQRELLASRWRRLGRRLRLAKRASFEA